MRLYTRRQLVLLLVLLAAGGLGLAVRHWRATHAALAERLERFDLDDRDADEARAYARPAPRRLRRGDDAAGDAGAGPAPRSARSSRPVTSSDGPAAAIPIDLNRATADDLARLPGVGRALAARIVAARSPDGFESVDDLERVRGLGPMRLERLRPLLTVEATARGRER